MTEIAAIKNVNIWLADRTGGASDGPGRGLSKWMPAVALPVLAAVLGRALPGWVLMWVMAFALFSGAKWLTICRLVTSRTRITFPRLIAYSLFWPGMDALRFCTSNSLEIPPVREWAIAAIKTLLGAALIWFVVPLIGLTHPFATGWMGMIGLALLLHFGLFHLLSLFWRTLGVAATPLMDSPASATSLRNFWSRRWNTAFSDLMQGHLLKPWARRLGPRRAVLGIFLLSGLLHELVISWPAHGGYGLPTGYFAIQGMGMVFEGSRFGKRLGLGSRWKGRCFVALVTGASAFWLFHPTFVRNVILPMLRAIDAT